MAEDTSTSPIPQKFLLGDERTMPELSVVRKMLEQNLPPQDKTTIKDIKAWLQIPILGGKIAKLTDGSCEPRAKALAAKLGNLEAPSVFEFTTARTKFTTLEDQWKSVDAHLTKKGPVIILGTDTFVGGPKSAFKTGKAHHALLFLAFGKEDGADIYIGFDPDTSANDTTRDAINKLIPGGSVDELGSFELHQILSQMVLGTDGAVLGPLCRKYYPDKTKKFPTTNRFG